MTSHRVWSFTYMLGAVLGAGLVVALAFVATLGGVAGPATAGFFGFALLVLLGVAFATARASAVVEFDGPTLRVRDGLGRVRLQCSGPAPQLTVTQKTGAAIDGPVIAENTGARKAVGAGLRTFLTLTFPLQQRGTGDFLVLRSGAQRALFPVAGVGSDAALAALQHWLEQQRAVVTLDGEVTGWKGGSTTRA